MLDTLLRKMAVGLIFLAPAACAWLGGGTRTEALMPTLPWLLAFLFEGMLVFPQRRPYEDAVSARWRVWTGLRRDPLFYCALVFLLVLAIPFVNRAFCPTCDYPQILTRATALGLSMEDAAKAPVPFAPFCLRIEDQFNVLLWFLPALTGMLAAKHALSRHGKRLLMEMLVWNAAALAVLGFLQQGTGAQAPYWAALPKGASENVPFFATFGYANMGGAFFVMAFAFSIGLWQTRRAEVDAMPAFAAQEKIKERTLRRILQAHYPLVAAVLLFFGALCTLSRAAILCLFTLTVLAFVYHLLTLLFAHHGRAKRVRGVAVTLGGALFFLLAVAVFAPPDLQKELDSIDSIGVLDRVSGKAQYHARVAVEIFKDHPLFGVGGWGYKHEQLTYLTEDELKHMQIDGGANVHNDYLQFLCEHGLVGFLMLVAMVGLLVAPVFRDWCRLYRAARFMKADKAPPRPRAIFCLPAGAFWILLGDAALLLHACGDCPLRSGAVLSMFFISLACAEGYIPRDIAEEAT